MIRPVVREMVTDWSSLNSAVDLLPDALPPVAFRRSLPIVVLLAFPWWSSVRLPAVLEAREVAHIYPPQAARIARVEATIGKQRVERGDMSSPASSNARPRS